MAGDASSAALRSISRPCPRQLPTRARWNGGERSRRRGRPAARTCAPPADAMADYDRWLQSLRGRPVFVAYPLLFDMMFVYWYQIRFVGKSPFSHSGIDIKTMAYAALGLRRYRDATKRSMPAEWFGKTPHSHVALDDARGQGELFFNIRKALQAAYRTG